MIDRKKQQADLIRVPIYMTNGLGLVLGDLRRNPSAETQRQLLSVHGTIRKLQSILKAIPAGKERAKFCHRVIDERIAEKSEKLSQTSCRSGCSGCCHQEVEITGDEAELLAELVRNGVKIDMEKLDRQASVTHTPMSWWRQPNSERSCLFLGQDGKCRIYANRPVNCRKYFVVTPPEKCSEVSATGSITVGVVAIPDAEVAATAIVDLAHQEGRIGNLPKMLKKALK